MSALITGNCAKLALAKMVIAVMNAAEKFETVDVLDTMICTFKVAG